MTNILGKNIEDWGTVSSIINETPDIDEKLQHIVGRNGDLDYTESITGYPTFKNRRMEIELSFIEEDKVKFRKKINEIKNYCHGKSGRIILPDEPDFYYEGRISTKGNRVNSKKGVVKFNINAKPYKRKLTDTVIKKTVSGTMNIPCENLREPVVPTIEVSAEMTIKFGSDYSKTVTKGKHLLDIVFEEGENILNVTGNGTITITYREGSL